MKIFRRLLFSVLMAGMTLESFVFAQLAFGRALQWIALVATLCMIGALVWSILFLKFEPALTRGALLAVVVLMTTFFVLFLFYPIIGHHPDSR